MESTPLLIIFFIKFTNKYIIFPFFFAGRFLSKDDKSTSMQTSLVKVVSMTHMNI